MIKTPQTSIEAFLYNAINIEIYEELEENYLDEINTLDFFNLIYSELEFYLNNSENYLAIKEHFDAINFKNSKLTVKFFHWLPKIIKLEFNKRETSELHIKTLEVIEDNYFLWNFAQVKSTSKWSFDKIKNQPQEVNNSLPLLTSIFIETISNNNFNKYLKLHIVEPYVDYSYLFQRMLKENIIVKTSHLDFTNWLFDNQHISENIKDLIIKNNGFRSLSKSHSTQRENNFNNVFNL